MQKINLKGRSLLTWLDYSGEEIRYLLELAKKEKLEKGQRKQRFAGISVALLFEKRSTRTRCSFETAVGGEGGHPVFLSTSDIHLGGKETIEDTARVLGRLFDAIEFRGFKQSTVETLAKYSGVPVYNGLTDAYHPTQALADVQTIEENCGPAQGKKLCFVGDGRNNVANSLMVISAKLGMNFTVIAPDTLRPDEELVRRCAPLFKEKNAVCEITADVNAAKGADALYTDVWVSMGEEAKKAERVKLLSPYQVNEALFEKTENRNCVFLHCLPAVRGEEVTAGIIDGQQSRVWDEAENRKHTIKAIMLATLGL
ncbi:MAG: ornithine carbamoyltransferase [Spirochaetaceae bacterium]|jgi:ornithine carbamoyltransferase|nr:ornithine carbamoyltransferase [Spirochaetaceae bacterium]